MTAQAARLHVDDYWYESFDRLRLFSRVYPGPVASAPVVLCLHGLTRNGRDFEDLAPHLATRYRVIVPDVRGRGRSARDDDARNYQIPVYLRDLDRLLCGLGADRVAIIGTSMGGLIAMVLAATQPARISHIVLNDVGPEVDPKGLARIRGYAGKSAPVATWDEAVTQLRGIFSTAWPGLDDARWARLVRQSYRLNDHGTIETDADPMIGEVVRQSPGAAPDLWPLWGALAGVPILALRGEHSDILSVATLTRMHREKPDLEMLTVANRGHAPLLDEPESLAKIDAFLSVS